MSHLESEASLQEKMENVTQQQDEEKVEQRVGHEDTEGSGKPQDMQAMGAGDWPRERTCHTHERAIPIQDTVEALDITEEGEQNHRESSHGVCGYFSVKCLCVTGVETLLCYLELHPQRFVELLHSTLSVCKVSCYDGPRQLQKITKMYEKSLCFSEALALNPPPAGEIVQYLSTLHSLSTAALQLRWCWPDKKWQENKFRRVTRWSLMLSR